MHSRYYATVVYQLSVRKHSDQTVSLVLGWGWRVFFALFSVTALVFHLAVGPLGSAGWVLVGLCILAALYHEQWHFTSNHVTSESGLLFPAQLRRRRTFSRNQVIAIALRQHRHISGNLEESGARDHNLYQRPSLAGSMQRGFIQLFLEGEEQRWLVTTESLRNGPLVHSLAQELAAALDLPMIEETPE